MAAINKIFLIIDSSLNSQWDSLLLLPSLICDPTHPIRVTIDI
jgi:hypothetical protein